MSTTPKFIIQPHGRLNDWVADEKGYFSNEGLDYEFNVDDGSANAPAVLVEESGNSDVMAGAFESYSEGQGRKRMGTSDISCTCHWTVNQAAEVEEGLMWGKAYSVGNSAVMVGGDSDIGRPEDLADTEVAIGYHSGSRYSTIQALEVFLPAERINRKFGGLPWARVDLAPERYKHYFLNKIPTRFHTMIDARRFGVGERLVFLTNTRAMFETIQTWMHDRKLFDFERGVGVSYETSVGS